MFQPHRFSRTQSVADQFARCFDGAHRVFVTDIYAAGEKPIPGVSALTIVDRVRAHGKVAVEHVRSLEELLDRAGAELREGDMVITMGAGDIYRAGEKLLARLATAAQSKG
jgi:UDP-N-acetylmuramate--alanine ligase